MKSDSLTQLLETADSPLFVTHRHADRDALGAAIGLKTLLGCGRVCTPDGIAKPAQALVSKTIADPLVKPSTDDYGVVVVLDAPSSERIAPLQIEEPVLIDHHEPADLKPLARATYIDSGAGATAELVTRLASEAGWTIDGDAALPLLVGLLDDTGYLARASPQTIGTAMDLIDSLGNRHVDLPELLERPVQPGEQNARTLGTLRATGYRAGDWFIAVTRVGGHEAAAAASLRHSGVDLVVVCNERSDGLRLTARASESFTDQINVGSQLLPALTAEFDGDGGGHDGGGAAVLDDGEQSEIEQFLIAWVEQELGVIFGEVVA